MQVRRRRPMSEINIVPYIDVMLVLLVIFMATAPMLAQGIKLDLPQEASEPLERAEQDPLVVSIQADATIYLNVGGSTDVNEESVAVTREELEERVRRVVRVRPDVPVFIRGDVELPYGEVMNVMTILQVAGAESVGLLTEPPVI